jgi:L-seryl-tRNA(Ser) seleniumtransferase
MEMVAGSDNPFRHLPSVDALLQDPRVSAYAAELGHERLVAAARTVLAAWRDRLQQGQSYPGSEAITASLMERLDALAQPTLVPVINATGVVLHTNLGRAPLSSAVVDAMRAAAQGYSNLEFDLPTGKRGSRYVHAEELLCALTGAESALLVNNNAGAVLLVLAALAQGRQVIISRGQLVEIGGGFRIPEVMEQSGAQLVEVGTTNRTYLQDYRAAIGEHTAAILRVHTSNYRLGGFVHQPALSELVDLAHEQGLPLLDDLGSGTLLDTAHFGLAHEPTVQESIAAGADLVTFSGDKLLGGPQAGIIVGKTELIDKLRRWPLTRALRVDKTTIAGIQANLRHYLRGEALDSIPIWQMIALDVETLHQRALAFCARLAELGIQGELVAGRSMIGGGSLPEESLPTTLVALPGDRAIETAATLRRGTPAVVTRIQDGRVMLDLRTVLPGQEDALVKRVAKVGAE